MELEKNPDGLRVNALMSAAPFHYERAKPNAHGRRTERGKLHVRPVEKLPGTKVNEHKGHVREHLILNVKIFPLFLFCFDGATTLAMTGVSLRSKLPDPFTDRNKDDMCSFNEVSVMRRGKTLTDLAEDISPGCSDPTHHDHWLISYIVDMNRHSLNSEPLAARAH